MKVKQVSLKLKEEYINPWFCSKPYDTPYHLRTMYEKEIEVFLVYCEEKNLKLKAPKMTIGEEVEFAGTTIRAETVKNEDTVSIIPRDKRIKAFFELKKPETKK